MHDKEIYRSDFDGSFFSLVKLNDGSGWAISRRQVEEQQW